MIAYCLVIWFSGISTFIGYLMTNPFQKDSMEVNMEIKFDIMKKVLNKQKTRFEFINTLLLSL